VLYTVKGTALFDTVAISGTTATVRIGVGPDAAVGAGVGGRGAGPIAIGVAAPACAQFGGGVVKMDDGAVTFKGGSISNTKATVRAPSARGASPAPWYGMLRGAAWPMDGAHGAAHACCGERCTVYGACGRRGACEDACRIVAEGATPSETEGCMHRGIPCAEAT
jgi:hypothetical protein